MILVQKATEEDFFTIQQIAHQTWPQTFGNILSKDQISYMLEMMYSPKALLDQVTQKGHVFLKATEEDKALGFISYEFNYKQEPACKIHKVYVLPEAHGKGLGKKLIQAVATIAQQQHNQSLTLNVNRYNPAVQFYQHLGFTIAGEENIDIGQGFLMEDYIMQKML